MGQVIGSRWLSVVGAWLLRAVDGTFASASGPGAMARMLGALYALGATIGAVTLLLPEEPGTNDLGLACVFAAAYAMAALLLVVRDRVGPWQLVPALAAATVLITLAVVFSEGRSALWAMFYIWVALVAGYFLTWVQAACQAALVLAGYAIALAVEQPEGIATSYLIAMGTVVVAGIVVGSLRRGVATLCSNIVSTA